MQDISRNVMNAIKMNRLELLEIVRANKLTHVAQYAEAVEDYKSLENEFNDYKNNEC